MRRRDVDGHGGERCIRGLQSGQEASVAESGRQGVRRLSQQICTNRSGVVGAVDAGWLSRRTRTSDTNRLTSNEGCPSGSEADRRSAPPPPASSANGAHSLGRPLGAAVAGAVAAERKRVEELAERLDMAASSASEVALLGEALESATRRAAELWAERETLRPRLAELEAEDAEWLRWNGHRVGATTNEMRSEL